MYEVLKMLHVFAVILLGGTILLNTLIGRVLPRVTQVAELRPLTQVMRTNLYLDIVALLTIPLFGYATAGDGGLSLSTTWLLVSQVLFWVAVAVVLAVLIPGSWRLTNRVKSLPDGPLPEDLIEELKNPLPAIVGGVLTLFFLFIVYLMVVKPAW